MPQVKIRSYFDRLSEFSGAANLHFAEGALVFSVESAAQIQLGNPTLLLLLSSYSCMAI